MLAGRVGRGVARRETLLELLVQPLIGRIARTRIFRLLGGRGLRLVPFDQGTRFSPVNLGPAFGAPLFFPQTVGALADLVLEPARRASLAVLCHGFLTGLPKIGSARAARCSSVAGARHAKFPACAKTTLSSEVSGSATRGQRCSGGSRPNGPYATCSWEAMASPMPAFSSIRIRAEAKPSP